MIQFRSRYSRRVLPLLFLIVAALILCGCGKANVTVYVAQPTGSAANKEAKKALAEYLLRLSGGSTVTVLTPAPDGGSPTRAFEWEMPRNLSAREREEKAKEALREATTALDRVVFPAERPLSDLATIWTSLSDDTKESQTLLVACALSQTNGACPSLAPKKRSNTDVLLLVENDRPQLAARQKGQIEQCFTSWGARKTTLRFLLRPSSGEPLRPAHLTIVNHTRGTDTLTLLPESGSTRSFSLTLPPSRKGTLLLPPGTYKARLVSGSALFPDVIQRTRFREGIEYTANYGIGGTGERLRIGEPVGFLKP